MVVADMGKEVARGSRPVFRAEYLDFQRGIRVGNLEESERITRLLKLALEACYGEPFVTERYGRGVYWRWIGLLPRSNRAAKPQSSEVSFGCSKFFSSLDVEDSMFKCGMQVERGFLKTQQNWAGWKLAPDWDWHRLLKALTPGGKMEHEIRRLLGEGFLIHAGSWDEGMTRFSKSDYPGVRKLRQILESAPAGQWVGFQLFYPATEQEVKRSTGPDLVDSMLAAFREVLEPMNLCMQVRLEPH
jgi:hypothetical protein